MGDNGGQERSHDRRDEVAGAIFNEMEVVAGCGGVELDRRVAKWRTSDETERVLWHFGID